MKRFFQSKKFILVLLWLVFTTSLAIWWWIYGLRELEAPAVTAADLYRKQLMIFWEGLILVLMILVGGSSLLYLLYRDHLRHQKLRLFFSTFTHDIKTSISRLSLQMEILSESKNSEVMQLAESWNRLDLQLENSLLFVQTEEFLKNEVFSLQQVIGQIRPEFPELTLRLEKEIRLLGDHRAMKIILRNLFQNSTLHGKATEIKISFKDAGKGRSRISFLDNGIGYPGDISQLGQEMLGSVKKGSNGLGLFLVRTICEKMNGSALFSSSAQGFQVDLVLKTLKQDQTA